MEFEVIPIQQVIQNVTVVGKLGDISDENELRKLLIRFSISTMIVSKYMYKGYSKKFVEREVYDILKNCIYAESCIKQAKAISEACKVTNGVPYENGLKSLFLFSRGNKWERYGNRNIKLIKYHKDGNYFDVEIVNPFGKNIFAKAYFGKRTSIILDTLTTVHHYSARIVCRELGKCTIHISIPIEIYVRHTKVYDSFVCDRYVCGFDLNAGFVNFVIVDKLTWKPVYWSRIEFWEVCSPGYPKDRLYTELLHKIGNLYEWLRYFGVSDLFFENLFKVKPKKQKRKFKSKNVARKVTRFPKRKLLTYMGVKGLKYGFRVWLVDPRGSSLSAKYLGKYLYNFDRHYGAAYVITLRGLQHLSKHMKTYTII